MVGVTAFAQARAMNFSLLKSSGDEGSSAAKRAAGMGVLGVYTGEVAHDRAPTFHLIHIVIVRARRVVLVGSFQTLGLFVVDAAGRVLIGFLDRVAGVVAITPFSTTVSWLLWAVSDMPMRYKFVVVEPEHLR
ncbi:hypothetical protein B0J13DRAFT_519840 [Dactylonectria estremocensis]|uniref:Uncharacterized protein n=1 Tax=Dactylonectria estremocensis TaxID=1079267 RepID=A0A9P9FEI7_9HYPO|nr:hypothetical protein B0J13DRAFT_519840 [Dactylonectria estremocensis]